MRARLMLAAAAVCVAGAAAAEEGAGDAAWRSRVTLYGWFAGLEGDIFARNRGATAGVSLSPSDVLDNLELGAFAFAEARRGRLGVMLDAAYVDLESSQDVASPAPARITGDTQLLLVTAAASWRVAEQDGAFADVYAGGRLTSVDVGLRAQGAGGADLRATRDESWVDPLIGLRVGAELTDRLSVWGLVDVGGFGVGSDFAWQAYAGARYALSDRISAEAGFRYVAFDYSAARSDFDMRFWGPTVGVSVGF